MITSASNNRIKNVIQLLSKSKARKQSGLFVVEGLRMAKEAPEALLQEVYVSEDFLQKEENCKAVESLGIAHEVVANDVFRKMSDTVTPQGILCVLKQPSYTLEQVIDCGNRLAGDNSQETISTKSKAPLYLLAEDVQDPGNLGTMLRTGEGAGISGLIMTKGSADIFNPKVIRSTMGSIFRIPFCYVENMEETIKLLRGHQIKSYAAYLEGSVAYDEPSYIEGTALLIGNEGNGLKAQTALAADARIRIPMEGEVESLNAAISAAVLMYEAKRQRDSI